MSKLILHDFKCKSCGTTQEALVPSIVNIRLCQCGMWADRVISGTNFRLDGTDPAYPTAWDKWAKQHEKAGGQDPSV
jgi:hypothetical protein